LVIDMPVLQEETKFLSDTDALSDLERARLGQLIDKHWRTLYGYAMRMGRNPDVADDLVAETVATIASVFRRFRPRHTVDGDFLGWAKRIMYNAFINEYRSKRRRQRRAITISMGSLVEEHGEDWGPIAAGLATTSAEQDVLSRLPTEAEQRVLTKMNPNQLVAIQLWMEGLSYKEIANQLREPLGTVRSQIHRARKLLKSTQKV
jgi:RNA polymerase sigma-70 factor (ECF subfamily)